MRLTLRRESAEAVRAERRVEDLFEPNVYELRSTLVPSCAPVLARRFALVLWRDAFCHGDTCCVDESSLGYGCQPVNVCTDFPVASDRR